MFEVLSHAANCHGELWLVATAITVWLPFLGPLFNRLKGGGDDEDHTD
jgi:hypothetical protein